MNAIDANILIYAMDESDLTVHQRALDFLKEQRSQSQVPQLMWQVACETLGWLRKRESQGLLTRQQVEAEIQAVLSAFPLIAPQPDAFNIALRLKSRYSLSHWDSLLLGACIDAGVTTLYSEDMSHGMTYDTVTVINPFKTA